jgi:hypothetical protein
MLVEAPDKTSSLAFVKFDIGICLTLSLLARSHHTVVVNVKMSLMIDDPRVDDDTPGRRGRVSCGFVKTSLT